jgi:hypothetical protein
MRESLQPQHGVSHAMLSFDLIETNRMVSQTMSQMAVMV